MVRSRDLRKEPALDNFLGEGVNAASNEDQRTEQHGEKAKSPCQSIKVTNFQAVGLVRDHLIPGCSRDRTTP
jgi:hypothetical protein